MFVVIDFTGAIIIGNGHEDQATSHRLLYAHPDIIEEYMKKKQEAAGVLNTGTMLPAIVEENEEKRSATYDIFSLVATCQYFFYPYSYIFASSDS